MNIIKITTMIHTKPTPIHIQVVFASPVELGGATIA
jgi:hypothetical protein